MSLSHRQAGKDYCSEPVLQYVKKLLKASYPILRMNDKILEFPRMKNLKKLKITGSFLFGVGINFEGIYPQFPKIESLIITRVVGIQEFNSYIKEANVRH